MKQILFISVPELKEYSIIQDNVGEKVLNLAIKEFQELELVPLIGADTYKKLSNVLVSGKTVSGYTYSDEDALLLEYIKPVMVYGALLYSLNPIHYKVTAKGVQTLKDDNSNTSDLKDLEALRSSYSAKLDGYKSRLIEHLRTDENDETDVPSEIDTTFGFTGISLPDDSYNYSEAYKSRAYKTGYYRRLL
jgi:hypothetical protein